MERKKSICKTITITLFSVIFLQSFIICIFDFLKYILSAGEWTIDYIKVIEMLVCLVVIFCLAGGTGKVVEDQTKRWRKWLYVIPVLFSIFALIHRVAFYREELRLYFAFRQRNIFWGFEKDFSILLMECAVLFLMLSMINPLALENRGEKKEINKYALVAGVLFIILLVWNIYKYIFIEVYHYQAQIEFRFYWKEEWAQRLGLLCGFGLLAFGMLKEKWIIILLGAASVILYEIMYQSFFLKYIENIVWPGIYYWLGYGCIVAFAIVTNSLHKKGKCLKSSWWLAFPIVFMILGLGLIFNEIIVNGVNYYCYFIDDYNCLVHWVAIVFAMIWAIYPKGLPKKQEIER